MAYGEWHYQRCNDCGTSVLTRAINGCAVYCKECIREHKAEQQRRRKRTCFHKETMNVIIVSDPIPVQAGGFRCGASISIESLEAGIIMRIFLPGTEFDVKGIKKIINDRYKLVDV